MFESYLDLIEMCYFEVKEAFGGLPDAHVWQRPAPRLLSIGEIVGHMMYWEAGKFAPVGTIEDRPPRSVVSSPLIDDRFRYYTTNLDLEPGEGQLALSASAVLEEVLRIHNETFGHFRALIPDIERGAPGVLPAEKYTFYLKYNVFHVSYHTGQIYTARHLFGEETPDN